MGPWRGWRLSLRRRVTAECQLHGRFLAVFALLALVSLLWLQLSCQHLHHCGVHLVPTPWPPYEREREERSSAYLEQERWRQGPRPPHVAMDRGFPLKLCVAMVTVERRQRYVMQSVASLLFHARADAMSNESLFFLVAGEAALEPHPDAEHLHATLGIPLVRTPVSGFCTQDRARVNFYGRKAEVFAYAIDTCRSRLAEDGWIILLEDDVVSSRRIFSSSWNVLKSAGQGVSLVKLFEPDQFRGWAWDNLWLLLRSASFLTLAVCGLSRKVSVLVFVVCFALNVVWLRALPLQVWALFLRTSAVPKLYDGAIRHATQAVAIPVAKNVSLSLQNKLCESTRLRDEINQDLIMMHWAMGAGRPLHASPSVFQHIGAMTSVKGPHQGWKLVDLTFEEEEMPFESWRSRVD
jgi:hypothetical protein